MILLAVFTVRRLLQDFIDVDIASRLLRMNQDFRPVLTQLSVDLLPGTDACGS